MTRLLKIFVFSFCLFSLTGCVTREQADAKIARACLAGIDALLPEGKDIGEVISTKFSPSPVGPDFRHVSIMVNEQDGWLENEVEYECTFQEGFGVFRLHYTASIHQLKFGSTVIGKAGDKIVGSFEQFTKLTDAIRVSLYENP